MKILSMDLGKSKTVSCLLETSDGSEKFSTVPMLPERIKDLVERSRPDRVVFEVCSDAGWIADICRELKIEFEAVNSSTLMHCMHHRRAKTDRKDARDLALASALNKTRSVHIPEKPVREWRALIEQRGKAVERATGRRNQIRSMFQVVGIPIPGGRKAWSARGIATLVELASGFVGDEHTRFLIALEGLRFEEREIAELEKLLDAKAKQDPRVARLQSVAGVGPRGAETVVAFIDNPHRFKSAKQVGCYAGLTPRPNQSGATDRSSRISKAGPSRLRSTMVQVAWMSLRWNQWAREVFERASRGSKSRRKQAIVAVARRLLVRLWAMMRDGTTWDAEHATRKTSAAA